MAGFIAKRQVHSVGRKEASIFQNSPTQIDGTEGMKHVSMVYLLTKFPSVLPESSTVTLDTHLTAFWKAVSLHFPKMYGIYSTNGVVIRPKLVNTPLLFWDKDKLERMNISWMAIKEIIFYARKVDESPNSVRLMWQAFRRNQDTLSCIPRQYPEMTNIAERDVLVLDEESVDYRRLRRRGMKSLGVPCKVLAFHTGSRAWIIPSIEVLCRKGPCGHFTSWKPFWKSWLRASENVSKRTAKNHWLIYRGNEI